MKTKEHRDRKKAFFTKSIMTWNSRSNNRDMPWKGEKDPYKIWLSEIILQQTRVDQGLDYYKRFLKQFPGIKDLAAAPEQKIFKLWEGLGYYTRCKNLIATAKYIAKEKKGNFPDTYDEILSLKGVGTYTAAAIASFAFNLPYAVLDGNVFRVLSRFFGIEEAINSTKGKKTFTSLSAELLNNKKPGVYNQAIMDLGAVICKPQNPLCKICPLKTECFAGSQELIDKFPVKTITGKKKPRWFYYLLVEHNKKIYVHKRGPNDIWENLYDFVLVETSQGSRIDEIKESKVYKKIAEKNNLEVKSISRHYLQHLSHQTIRGSFIHIQAKKALELDGFRAVSFSRLQKLPFPRFITRYLAETDVKAFER